MKQLGTIKEEEAECRAAFTEYNKAAWVWCCHHGILCENLTEPAENRIDYILSSKNKSEQALRLRNFRPCKNNEAVASAIKAYNEAVEPDIKAYNEAVEPAIKAYDEAVASVRKALEQLHNSEWPNSWNGKSIFK